jgi:hypothetical protein
MHTDWRPTTMKLRIVILLLLALVLAPFIHTPAHALGNGAVIVDGDTEDWAAIEPLTVDAVGDGMDVDFDTLSAAVVGRWLVLRFNTGEEVSLANGSPVELLLDGDADPATGAQRGGLGSELLYRFGEREGVFFGPAGEAVDVGQGEIGLVQAPTVTSTRFEVALPLDAMVEGSPLFTGREIVLALRASGLEGDRVPDEGGVRFVLPEPRPQGQGEARLDLTPAEGALRLVSWNVLHDGLLKRPESFEPLLQAIGADVYVFEEAWEATPEQVMPLLGRAAGGDWVGAKQEILLMTRMNLLGSWPVEGARAGAFLLDAGELLGSPLLVVGAHLPCCDKDEARQLEIDAIHAFLREAREGEVAGLELTDATPVVIAGDMNLVGESDQRAALRTGTLFHPDRFGPERMPDGDDTPLAEVELRHPFAPFVFTWQSPESEYPPGQLDFVFYTDSVLEPRRAWVLHTPLLPEETLDAMGLEQSATAEASDHIPLVVDFIPRVP